MPELKFDEEFLDPNTGETVKRIKVPEKDGKELLKFEQEGQAIVNNFLMVSINICGLMQKWTEFFTKKNSGDEAMGKEIVRVREKMSLDSAWVYNLPLRAMEKREPPQETRIIEPQDLTIK